MDLEVHPYCYLVCTRKSALLEKKNEWYSYRGKSKGVTVYVSKKKDLCSPCPEALDELMRARLSFFGEPWHKSENKNFPVVFHFDLPSHEIEAISERVYLFSRRKNCWNVIIRNHPEQHIDPQPKEEKKGHYFDVLDHFYFGL